MLSILIALLCLCLFGLVGALWMIFRSSRRYDKPLEILTASLGVLQAEVFTIRQSVKDQSQDLSRQVQDLQSHNASLFLQAHQGYSDAIGKVQNRLGELSSATQSMIEIGKDIASLQDILKAPKMRGGLGETILEELLRQILPVDHFSFQYAFKNGTKVDAVIHLGQQMIPVDAKFPLENFKRVLENKSEDVQKQSKKAFIQDVKKHIDDIASKYILPAEGTYEFALMYIPAENIYYETIIKEEGQAESLSDYAIRRKVVPVSPNSFYAYLQAIVRGLKGMRVEQSAQKILQHLGQLAQDFERLATDLDKVGSHLSNAVSAYERTAKAFDKINGRLQMIDTQKTAGEINPSISRQKTMDLL